MRKFHLDLSEFSLFRIQTELAFLTLVKFADIKAVSLKITWITDPKNILNLSRIAYIECSYSSIWSDFILQYYISKVLKINI